MAHSGLRDANVGRGHSAELMFKGSELTLYAKLLNRAASL